ncbi:MAG: BlaI/MecI/CopY family transcriptional regulator [Deltaproteobacteria bacterium]|nr:BlaI/MecI/CopY family transcriptional regulator [Deltaproteobacteria bacterium]
MSKTHRLGDLQLAILRVLWRRGTAAVTEVHKDLEEERGLAPTTIATMLVKLEKKGVVAHSREGRRFLYRAIVSEGEVRSTMVGDLTQRLFAGDPAALVSHLLVEHEIDPTDLERLREMIALQSEEPTRSEEPSRQDRPTRQDRPSEPNKETRP